MVNARRARGQWGGTSRVETVTRLHSVFYFITALIIVAAIFAEHKAEEGGDAQASESQGADATSTEQLPSAQFMEWSHGGEQGTGPQPHCSLGAC